jgi:hypothetical protein
MIGLSPFMISRFSAALRLLPLFAVPSEQTPDILLFFGARRLITKRLII